MPDALLCIGYDPLMRTTVSLPLGTHRRVCELARQRGLSVSATIADLTARGLAQLDLPAELDVDARTGIPVLSLGRAVTPQDVAKALDDD